MLYIKKYLLRNQRKQLPLLTIIIIFTFLTFISYNFITILQKQKLQLFEQYKDFSIIHYDSNIDFGELNQLKKKTASDQYDINLSYFPIKLLFGQDVIEIYGLSRIEWARLNFHYNITYHKIDFFKPFAVFSTACQEALSEQTFKYKSTKIPVIGEIDAQGKFGFLVGVNEGIPGLLVWDSLSPEQIESIYSKYTFVNNIVTYEEKLKKNRDELLFINMIYNIIISTTILISCFIIGISTYLSITNRKSEIAISQVFSITQEKIIFKFIFELFCVFSLGIIIGLIASYFIWNIIFIPYLIKLRSYISFTLPIALVLGVFSAIIPGVFIIFKTVKSQNPIEVILKNKL